MSNFRPLYGENYLPSNEGTVDTIQTSYGTEVETSAYDGYSPYVRSRMNPAHMDGVWSSVKNYAKRKTSSAWRGVKNVASDTVDAVIGDTKKKAVAKATEIGGETAGKLVSSALNTSTSTTRKGGKGNSSDQKLSRAMFALKGPGVRSVGPIFLDLRPSTPFHSSSIINQFPKRNETLNQIRNSLGIRQQGPIFRLPTGETIGVEDTKFKPIDIQLLLAKKLKGFLDSGMPMEMAIRNLMNNHPYISRMSFTKDKLIPGTKRSETVKITRSSVSSPTTPNALSFNIGDGDSPRPRARELAGNPFPFDWAMYEQFLSTRVPSIESLILRLAPNWRTSPISRTQMKTLADELAVNFGARVTISNSQGKYTSPNPENIIAQRSRATQVFVPQEQPTQVFVPQEPPIQTQAAADAAPAATEEENKEEETPKEKPFLKTPLGIATAVLGTAAVLGGVYYVVSKD